MKFLGPFFLAALATLVHATSPPKDIIAVSCYTTELTKKAEKQKTTSVTQVNTHTEYTKSTIYSTITPPIITKDSLVIITKTTTLPQYTNTVRVTQTVKAIQTITLSPYTISKTSTVTIKTDTTTTVPTPAGFTAILDSKQSFGYSISIPGGRRRPNENSGARERLSVDLPLLKKFYGDVTCYVRVIHYITVSAGVEISYTTVRPSTKTITRTIYTTVTEAPVATTTLTYFTTHTSTTSITPLFTTTVKTSTTIFTSTSTAYAACASNNFANQVKGKSIVGVYSNLDAISSVRLSLTVTDAQACCNAAFQNYYGGSVGVGAFSFDASLKQDNCKVARHLQCLLPRIFTGFYASGGSGQSYVVGNGPCSQFGSSD